MIYSIHTMELSNVVDTDTFQKVKNKAYKKAKGNNRMFFDKSRSNKHIDFALAKKGIKIEYHDDQYKKKIKLIINPTKILGGNDILKLWEPNRANIDLLLDMVKKHIIDYFDEKYNLNDFRLSRVDFTVNIDVGNKERVGAYIKVFHRLGKVKGYSCKYTDNDSGIDKNLSFDLEGNSNGIEFTAYDKESESKLKEAEGILRLEVRLVKQKSIKSYTKETKTTKQIVDLALKSKEIFLTVVGDIVPHGNYYKKHEAIKIINENIPKKKAKEKMIRLLELIPKKKSLYLARKEMDDRNIDEVIDMFGSINVSPVTISKSCKVKRLDNVYTYLFDDA